ncbi:MAG: bifunctional 5,10-methylene-tetrahydrofolate dehydrogenase/5,10-methylene-tetrahydrofolate cyclohydrolase [Clostridiales bacterium]|nr:bifunctional 5,10-methylene-tetrahydrofolate dehydrogenase/5,10-methylene-tetrahydrofolate cyclohydrolase [Clostridiales bacterium]
MAELLKGAPIVAALNEKLIDRVAALKEKGVVPTLAIVRLGERSEDIAYENGAMKRCKKIGVSVKQFILPEGASQNSLIDAIGTINAAPGIHGALLFRPLPKHIDESLACNSLAAEKDVDGITNASMAGVFAGTDLGYPPCTPRACMEILDYYGIDPKGKRAVVVGRSLVVGKPAAMMLLRRHATVTICHTRTADMAAACREAEILAVAAGRANVVGSGYLAPGQIVLDVGINADESGGLCGDVDFAAAEGIVKAITPVPGGVGTVTASVLAKHVVEAAEKAAAAMAQ